jgi:hypothetical protein
MLYILDVSAINLAGRRDNAPLILEALGDLIESSVACFPDEVLAELERLARGEFTYTWAKAAAPNRFDKGASYKVLASTSHQVRGLVDIYAEYESSACAVLAQARSLGLDGRDVSVVTEDTREKPTRMSLAAACDQMDVRWVPLNDCLLLCGHDDLVA